MTNKGEVLQILGATIRRLREQSGMSLDELARKSGYTSDSSRSTMQKIESGQRDIPASKLKAIALALHTTPGELIGMVSPEPAPAATSLSADEESLIDDYRVLNDTGKQEAREYVSDLTENVRYTYEPSLLAAHKRTDIDPDPEGDAADIALVMKLAKESNGGS